MNILHRTKRAALFAAVCLSLLLGLNACSSGGGGDRASGVVSGPSSPNQPITEVEPPEPVIIPVANAVAYAEAETLKPVITSVNIPADGRPEVAFQLSDQRQVAIVDLQASQFRFAIAKLQPSSLGNATGSWQSYINTVEQPSVGPGTAAKLQATNERATQGSFTNHLDGTYSYKFATDITTAPSNTAAQAQIEGLDLSYDPSLIHRVAIQFDGARNPANPIFDWIPATGEIDPDNNYDVVATENCNACHERLALHGGNRFETEYCVTCHNPGSTDANSGNSVDFKEMIHKIHRGAELPSVEAGGDYVIYGFRNSLHDYSNIHYPQDIRNCVACHAGSATGNGNQVATAQGDNWAEYPSRAACGSCHDLLDFATHEGGQTDDSDCASCHSVTGEAGSIFEAHRNLIAEASEDFAAEVISVSQSGPGEMPQIQFAITNPNNDDAPYDILNDPSWSGARLALTLSWDTRDYHNTGNGRNDSSSVSINALTSATPVGDGSFLVNATFALPDGSAAPNIPANGSGAVVIEGRANRTIEGSVQRVPLNNAVGYFSIDEVNGSATPRREVVSIDQCLVCHGSLSLHGGSRNNSIESCVTCHNPRNTDRQVRSLTATPPSDGKSEESLDFKTMIHAIHAAAYREDPIQIVGFNGNNVYVFDENSVHYPGRLANCNSCHVDDSYRLPLASTVLATSIDTGADRTDPSDDIVVSPASAVCSSCHDSALAKAHMQSNGGSFNTTQNNIDNGIVLEQCELCHGSGGIADIEDVHGL